MKHSIKLSALVFALFAVPIAGAIAAPATCSVSLAQDPLPMRIGKDEFRIAFGLDAASCEETGCSGSIRYKATWQTEDGRQSTELKSVGFTIPNGARRSISVDRHYFDTAEAQHTTRIAAVDIDQISCDAAPSRGLASR